MPPREYEPQSRNEDNQATGQGEAEKDLPQDHARNEVKIQCDAQHQWHEGNEQQASAEEKEVLAYLTWPRLPMVGRRRHHQRSSDRQESQGE